MTTRSDRDLDLSLVEVIDLMERFGAVVVSPDGQGDATVAHEPSGLLRIRLEARLSSRSGDADIELIELWGQPARTRGIGWSTRTSCAIARLGYRRAFHRHDVNFFVRRHDVATHEHCESTIGGVVCHHSAGEPVHDATDGFLRLYGQWLQNSPPDCAALRCLD
ncbi:MAG: hypothetical protein R3C32_00465 [Chloroflexota bacterium]